MKTKIPHKCVTCNKQLYLENRVYHKNNYYCKDHWNKRDLIKKVKLLKHKRIVIKQNDKRSQNTKNPDLNTHYENEIKLNVINHEIHKYKPEI